MPLCFRGQVRATWNRTHTGLLARSCRSGVAASITLILARVKNSALEPGLEMSTMLLLPASRGQVELFGEQPTREPTPFRFPHTLSLARSSSSPSLSFFHPCSISPPSVFVSLPVCLVLLGRFIRIPRWPASSTPFNSRKDHLVLYIVAPAAIILPRVFKNIRRSCWISQRKSVTFSLCLIYFSIFFTFLRIFCGMLDILPSKCINSWTR